MKRSELPTSYSGQNSHHGEVYVTEIWEGMYEVDFKLSSPVIYNGSTRYPISPRGAHKCNSTGCKVHSGREIGSISLIGSGQEMMRRT